MLQSKKSRKRRTPLFSPLAHVDYVATALKLDLDPSGTHLAHSVGKGAAMQVAYELQTKDFSKKFRSSRKMSDLSNKALDKFIKVNQVLGDFDFRLPSPDIRPHRCSPRDRALLRARSLIHHVLGDFDEHEWFTGCKHSSGVSLGIKFQDTSLTAKWETRMTCTARARPLLLRYVMWDTTLRSLFGTPNFEIVEGSRATTVPKDDRSDRLICIEPTGNMYLQQGLASVITARLRKFGIDIKWQQRLHRRLALVSSVTGRLATIDWASASDSVAVDVCKFLLPPIWFEVLSAVRCSSVLVRGKAMTPAMISSMGIAFTFPLETLIFWALAVSTVSLTDDSSTSCLAECQTFRNDITVFGDDCILPTFAARDYMDIMSSVGFTVNSEKSFFGEYRFRESCGLDAFEFRNVRPYHIRAPSGSSPRALEAWLYTVFNGLLKKYISYFGDLTYVYDKYAFKYLAALFRSAGFTLRVIPVDYPDDSGLKWRGDRRLLDYFVKSDGQPCACSDVLQDMHGTCTFQFLRYIYPHQNPNPNKALELWRALKFPGGDKASTFGDPIRIGGKYVVAIGESFKFFSDN